jgi:hypothetical protein
MTSNEEYSLSLGVCYIHCVSTAPYGLDPLMYCFTSPRACIRVTAKRMSDVLTFIGHCKLLESRQSDLLIASYPHQYVS